tara:strand:- start:62 stop:619 length:558 start_codon:yes stop_codon:yes gene_type:complete
VAWTLRLRLRANYGGVMWLQRNPSSRRITLFTSKMKKNWRKLHRKAILIGAFLLIAIIPLSFLIKGELGIEQPHWSVVNESLIIIFCVWMTVVPAFYIQFATIHLRKTGYVAGFIEGLILWSDIDAVRITKSIESNQIVQFRHNGKYYGFDAKLYEEPNHVLEFIALKLPWASDITKKNFYRVEK